MILSNDGLTLHFGTTDAPSPTPFVRRGEAPTLTVGVAPPSPANSVSVSYRVDDGPTRMLAAPESRVDYSRGVQYFTASFPRDLDGDRVEYCPVAKCAGRQVPSHGAEHKALSAFSLAKSDPEPTSRRDQGVELVPRFAPELEFIAQVTVPMKPPVLIGQTPIGLRVDYYGQPGTVRGGVINATVLENAADYLIVRPDGIGLIDVHATLKTDDGAMITSAYVGLIDFGVDGYARMLAGDYPTLPPLQISPRLMTEHPRYLWMNRTYFLGVGSVDMKAAVLSYDVYAVRTAVPSSST
jgi:hypothetical protein